MLYVAPYPNPSTLKLSRSPPRPTCPFPVGVLRLSPVPSWRASPAHSSRSCPARPHPSLARALLQPQNPLCGRHPSLIYLTPKPSARTPCSRGLTWAGPRVVRAAVLHGAARLVTEAARGPARCAGQVTAGAAAAQRGAALSRPQRAPRASRRGHRGHYGQGERQGQDPRRSAPGHHRAQARDRTPTGTDPTDPPRIGAEAPRSTPPLPVMELIHLHSSHPNLASPVVVKYQDNGNDNCNNFSGLPNSPRFQRNRDDTKVHQSNIL